MNYCDFCNAPLDHKGQCLSCGEFDPYIAQEHQQHWLESSHDRWLEEEIMGVD